MATVLIAGVGQIGSRHLQGIASCTTPLQIYLYDISPASLAQARVRWEQVVQPNSLHKISLHQTLSALPQAIDVAIIACTARCRSELVATVAEHTEVKSWILEKVLAQSEISLNELLLATGHAPAWVNTLRRMLPWHQQIKTSLKSGQIKHLTVSGNSWGLACNSVHFLDMLCWWTGEQLEEVNTDELASYWIDAKRPGNFEIMGKLRSQFSGGSSVEFQVTDGDLHYTFELTDGEFIWHMDETAGTAIRSDGLSIPGCLPFQSEVTAGLVESILTTGRCELPTLKESVDLHRIFVRALLAHWRETVDSSASSLPIT